MESSTAQFLWRQFASVQLPRGASDDVHGCVREAAPIIANEPPIIAKRRPIRAKKGGVKHSQNHQLL